MARYTKQNKDGRYYIESVNGKLESDKFGHTYGAAIDRFAEFEKADVVPKSEVDYARQCGYESGIRTGARKVFDAVDELIKDYAHNHLDPAELVVRLYLLKKKYTEGTKNE